MTWKVNYKFLPNLRKTYVIAHTPDMVYFYINSIQELEYKFIGVEQING